MAEHRIWFDCDTGVDDAIALLTAHRQPGLEIVGLSTVAGNVTLDHTTENTLKICGLMGADYPFTPALPARCAVSARTPAASTGPTASAEPCSLPRAAPRSRRPHGTPCMRRLRGCPAS